MMFKRRSRCLFIVALCCASVMIQTVQAVNVPYEDPNYKNKYNIDTPPETDNSTTSPECPACKEPTDPYCLSTEIPFGRMVHEPAMPNGSLLVRAFLPNRAIYQPAGLHFQHNLTSRIESVNEETDPDGRIHRNFVVKRPNGFLCSATQIIGDGIPEIAVPNGPFRDFNSRMYILPVEDRARRTYGLGEYAEYNLETKELEGIRTRTGRWVTLDDPGVGLEIIKDANGALRQIVSKADGLADIVTLSEFKYAIQLYAPGQEGTKNAQGLYEPLGDPHTVWTFENPAADHNKLDQILVTESVAGSAAREYHWRYFHAAARWRVDKGPGLVVADKSEIWDADHEYLLATECTYDGDGNPARHVQEKSRQFSWGPRLVESRVLTGGAEDLVTTYTYDADYTGYTTFTLPNTGMLINKVPDIHIFPITGTYNPLKTGSLGRRKSTTFPDGRSEYYTYDDEGRLSVKVETWKDTGGSVAAAAKATYLSYDPVPGSGDSSLEIDRRVRTETVKILGVPVSKSFYVYKTVADEAIEITERCADPASGAYGAPGNQRTTRTYHPEGTGASPSAGRLKTVEHPDGRLDTYAHEFGTYSSNADPSLCAFTPGGGGGDALRITVTHGTTASPAGIAGKTTREVTVIDGRGDTVLKETLAYTGSGYERIAWEVAVFDVHHHPTATHRSDNTTETATWGCCKKESEQSADGIERTYGTDLLDRVTSTTKLGHNGAPDLVTTYTLDAEGRRLSETVSAGGLSLATSTAYDLAGRVTSRTDQSGLATAYAYANGGRTVTVTLPGNAQEVTERYKDGRVKSVTGSGVVPRFYDYGVNPDGSQWTKVTEATSDGPKYAKTTTDPLGRVIAEERPAYPTGTVTTEYTHNTKGQLVKVEAPGMADTLHEYDDLGNLTRSGLDLNDNGTLDLASTDRITESETVYSLESGIWNLKSTQRVYATENSGTPTTVSTTRRQLTGLAAGVVARTVSTDIHGNETVSTTAIDRANKTLVQSTDLPDSTVDEQSVTVNGLLASSRSKSNLTTTYAYDALERQAAVTDPRTGATTIAYFATGTGKTGQVHTVTDPASNATTFDYDPATGRRTSVTNALGKATTYAYNDRGQITAVRGDASYPLDYEYDNYGRMIQLKTYRSDPSDPSNADITTWAYHLPTGLLTSKTYADSKAVSYTYSSDGKLATRTWARFGVPPSGGLLTSYSYNAATGELAGIDYSDSTPDVSFTYNRLGQQATVSDVVGTRTFSYNDKLAPSTETITGLYAKTLARTYDALGRESALSIDAGYSLGYGYDTYGRYNALSMGANTVTLGYAANADLVGGIARSNGVNTAFGYEANRDLVTQVAHAPAPPADPMAVYGYTNDAIGRRTAMSKAGTAFVQADTISYGYNDRSEVVSAVSANLATYDYGYDFDPIGNRLTAASSDPSDPSDVSYASNSLNQYTAITEDQNPPFNPTHDDDGNCTSAAFSTGTWSATWNCENRMVAIEKADQKIEFAYDYMGRRVIKKVYAWDTDHWSPITDHRFVYNGYRLAQTLDALSDPANAIVQEFAWSLDDELRLVRDGEDVYFVHHDANRNVTELTADDGTLAAHYEYAPFGKLTAQSGPYAAINPFRFSSEYFDAETGLVYYNYRYYSPEFGRWMSRDPIWEHGGVNIFIMVDNNPVTLWDHLGLGNFPLPPDAQQQLDNAKVKIIQTTLPKDSQGLDPKTDLNPRTEVPGRAIPNAVANAPSAIYWHATSVTPHAASYLAKRDCNRQRKTGPNLVECCCVWTLYLDKQGSIIGGSPGKLIYASCDNAVRQDYREGGIRVYTEGGWVYGRADFTPCCVP